MYKIRIYTIFRHSKSKQYRVTCCFCMEDSAVKVHYITQLTTQIWLQKTCMRSTSLFTSKRIGLRMSTTLSPEDTMPISIYEIRWWEKRWNAGKNRQMRWTKCCCDHKIWLAEERKHWARFRKHLQNFLDLSEIP